MKITPLDVSRQEFHLSFRGYHRDEVEDFLSRLATQYEQVVKENQSLREEVASLVQRLDGYRAMEENLKNSILLAQKVADEVRANARKEGELFLSQAREQCAREVEEANRQLMDSRLAIARFKGEMSALLETYRKMLGLAGEELLANLSEG